MYVTDDPEYRAEFTEHMTVERFEAITAMAAADVEARNGQASLDDLTTIAEKSHYRNEFSVAVARSIRAAI